MLLGHRRRKDKFLIVRIETAEQAHELIGMGLLDQGEKLVGTIKEIGPVSPEQLQRVLALGIMPAAPVDPLAVEARRANDAVDGIVTGVRSLLQEVGDLVAVVLGGGRRLPPEVTQEIADA